MAEGFQLQQGTPTTCGIMSLIAARACIDSDFREFLAADPSAVASIEGSLARRLGGTWPRALGTAPWELAREASRVFGVRYRVEPMTAKRIEATMRAMRDEAEAGFPGFVYVGGRSGQRISRVIPRHVVAVVPGNVAGISELPGGRYSDDVVLIFEPSSGMTYPVRSSSMVGRTQGLEAFGNWTHIQAVVRPRPSEMTGTLR